MKDFFFFIPSLHFSLFQDEKSKSSQDGDTYKWAGIEAVMQSYLMHAAGELCKSCNVESLLPVHSTLIHSRPANLSILSMTHCTYNLFNDFSRTTRFAIWFETKFSGFCLHELIPGSHLSDWGFNRTGHPRVGSGGMLFWEKYLRNVSHLRCIFSSYFQFKGLLTIVEHNSKPSWTQAKHSKSKCQNQ